MAPVRKNWYIMTNRERDHLSLRTQAGLGPVDQDAGSMISPLALVRAATAIFLSLTLAGCFFGPREFQSIFDIRKNVRFTYRHQGPMKLPFLAGEEPEIPKWNHSMARC